MGRPKKASSEEDSKHYNYKLLLYPDNFDHCCTFAKIQIKFPENFIAIKHFPETEGTKEHYHVYLIFESQRWWFSLLKDIGLETGQFCNPIEGRLDKALPYLVHRNQPWKQQYDLLDCFGGKMPFYKLSECLRRYEMANTLMADAVMHVTAWIVQQKDIITMENFTFWICQTTWFKASSSPLVQKCLYEHNQKIISERRRKFLGQSSDNSLDPDSFIPIECVGD